MGMYKLIPILGILILYVDKKVESRGAVELKKFKAVKRHKKITNKYW
jgi:hypothetical protein